jgi:arginine/lysine/ornithine decarboxylase
MPGERITQAHLEYLTAIVNQGGIITGCQDSSLETLKVLLI